MPSKPNRMETSTLSAAETTLDYLSASNNESTNATIGSSQSSSEIDIKEEDFNDRTDLEDTLLDREIEELQNNEFSPIGPNSKQPVMHSEFSVDRMYQRPFIDNSNGSLVNNHAEPENGEELIEEAVDEFKDEPLDLNDLPETVTVLRTPEGRIVYLVGTSHFSEASQRDVRRVIRAVRPRIVVLELCRSRMCFLHMSEEELMREAQSLDFKKIRDYIRRNGFLQGFIFTVLLVLSAKVAKDLNMAPGGEFRNAFNEALKIKGCTVYLGDRPIDITLRRAMAMLSFWQKIKMAWNCFSFDKLDKKELEKYKQRDVLDELIRELTQEYPGLKKVMVDERDAYLANNIWNACNSVSPGTPIVGVVGIGHSQGIEKYWDNAMNIEVDELLSLPVSKPSRVGRVVKYSVYGGMVYLVYRYAAPRVVKSTLNEVCVSAYNQISSLLR